MPARVDRDTVVAHVNIPDSARVNALLANRHWVYGTVTSSSRDTLYLDGGRREVPLRGLRQLHVASGEKGFSSTRMVFASLGGLLAGFMGGAVAASAIDPCKDDSGEICLDGFAYAVAGAGVGLFFGLGLGAIPAEKWVRVYPPNDDSRSTYRVPAQPDWRTSRLMR